MEQEHKRREQERIKQQQQQQQQEQLEQLKLEEQQRDLGLARLGALGKSHPHHLNLLLFLSSSWRKSCVADPPKNRSDPPP